MRRYSPPGESVVAFEVRMGVPEVFALWQRLMTGATAGTLSGDERELATTFANAVNHLGSNPFHPGLRSHEVEGLTLRYGQKVFQSYLENNTPAAGRIFWVYGPDRQQITVIGLEPHPEDAKHSAYRRVKLSALPAPATPMNHSTTEKPAPSVRRGRKPKK